MPATSIPHIRPKRAAKAILRKIMLYSHDTYGLGHIRRCLAIARCLRHIPANILIITGSIVTGRFNVPDRIDFVRIPGMIKKTNEDYFPVSMKLESSEVLEIRKKIILAAATGFQPEFFIVDKAPLGMKREVLDTLLWLRDHLPSCNTVLGLRDIMDDSGSTIEDWTEKDIYGAMRDLYDEIWVYGCREFYDSVKEYRIPEDVALKTHFTGYIHRKVPSADKISEARNSLGIEKDEKVVLVTTGGGGDGYHAVDSFISAFSPRLGGVPAKIRAIVVAGPFMASRDYQVISQKCSILGFKCQRFNRNMERLIGVADAVVSMGGYNTVCEIMSQRKPLLMLPRTIPREEQLIRARVLSQRGYCDYLDQRTLTAPVLRERVLKLLENREQYSDKLSSFPLTGLDHILRRIQARDETSQWETLAAASE